MSTLDKQPRPSGAGRNDAFREPRVVVGEGRTNQPQKPVKVPPKK